MFLIAVACLLFTHDYVVDSLIAAAAIRGRRLFLSTCTLVWLLFTGGVYSRAVSFPGNTVYLSFILSLFSKGKCNNNDDIIIKKHYQ